MPSGASSPPSVRGVLFGEQLGRRHQRGLEVVLHGEQHGEQRHDRLAGAHVAHQQPVHPLRRRHVGGDLAEGLLLVAGELVTGAPP